MQKEFNYSSVMAVPRLRKIVVNMGLGESIQNAKLLDAAADRKSTRLNSSHIQKSRMPSSA